MFMLEQRWTGALRLVTRIALVTAAALAAFAVLHPGAAAAQEGSPTISAELGGSVAGNWYTPDSTATVRIFASPGGALLYTGSAPTGEGWFEVERDTHGQELAAGMAVAVTDDATGVVAELTLVAVTFDYVNPTTDVASGTAPPGSAVTVYSAPSDGWVEGQEVSTTAGADGRWLADFGAAGLQTGISGSASVADEEGDRTIAWRSAPQVWVEYDYGNGPLDVGLGTDSFTANAAVDVQLFASPGGALLWSASLPTDEFGDVNRWVSELLDFDPAFGMHLVVTDPATTIAREVTLVRVTVDEVDPDADTVSGTAPAGAEIGLTEPEDAWRTETVADENGAWLVDLGAIGVDATWLSNVEAYTGDEDGDTILARGAPATIGAKLTTDTVSGSWFSLEAALAVEILDAGGAPLWTGTAPTGLGRSFAVGPDLHGLELLPGMQVRVTDPVGGFTKDVTIVPLSIDVLDPVRDFASGTGVPGTTITMGIWFPGEGGGQVADDIAVDATGAWSYDFANPPAGREPIDVLDDTIVDVAVPDAEWDSTSATITATPGAIAHLQDDVAELLAEGGLTAVEAAQLQNKLDDALGKLDDGKTLAAIEKLESFVARVESLVTAGKLSPAAGSGLIAQAAGVIAALRT